MQQLEEEKKQQRYACKRCDRSFDKKARLRRHCYKVHRQDNDDSKGPLEPHVIPASVVSLKIVNLYPAEKKAPLGYRPDQLPLARVTYYLGLEKVSDMIVSYEAVRQRFPMDVLAFMMGHITLMPTGGK